jgi:hypothetical protein
MEKLPDEIVFLVLEKVKNGCLRRCMLVCRRLHDLASDELFWKKRAIAECDADMLEYVVETLGIKGWRYACENASELCYLKKLMNLWREITSDRRERGDDMRMQE